MLGILKHTIAIVECRLPVAGPSGQQFHLHNLSRLHCSAPRWSPVRNRYAQHLSTTCFLPSCCRALWGLTTWLFLNYRVDSLTTSPLCYIFLNCAEKPTVACQVGWWEPSFCQRQETPVIKTEVWLQSISRAELTCAENMKSQRRSQCLPAN